MTVATKSFSIEVGGSFSDMASFVQGLGPQNFISIVYAGTTGGGYSPYTLAYQVFYWDN